MVPVQPWILLSADSSWYGFLYIIVIIGHIHIFASKTNNDNQCNWIYTKSNSQDTAECESRIAIYTSIVDDIKERIQEMKHVEGAVDLGSNGCTPYTIFLIDSKGHRRDLQSECNLMLFWPQEGGSQCA